MKRFVAFLRGMNLGGRRITNGELCASFEEMGFASASAFLASGNVVFEARGGASLAATAQRIEKGLKSALGYEVPTFLRSADEVAEIARCAPFPVEGGEDGGKVQVMMLPRKPAAPAAKRALELADADNFLHLRSRELYWLPRGGLSESKLDIGAIERLLGPTTTRTKNTIERLTAKYIES